MDDSGATIEQDVRFSESILWKLQRQYYDLRGPQAWASGAVPSYVTTNPYIAHVYAHIVLAYLRDAAASLDRERPIYIVELAAGSGRFAYLFLKAFHALKNASSVRALDVRYVMTDFTRANVRAWAAQPAFKPFLDAGLLDLGIFDAERDREIQLVGARGGVLAAGGLANPSIVLANYAFDTLVQDLFRVENGKLHEVRVSLRSRQAQPDLSRPEIMSELQCRYANREIGAAYYDDPGLNAMLEGYRASLAETTFAVPIGAFTALRNLIDIAGGRLLLLSSDKGYTHEDELYGVNQQPIEFHGSLSMMVNYHALGQYIAGQGGLYAATSPRQAGLKTAALILGGSAAQFTDTLLAFRERADVFGPYDLFNVLANLRKDAPTISPDHFLGLLRLSHFDPYIVHQFARDVVGTLAGAPEVLRMEIRLALDRVQENYYPVGNDLPFELARLYMALKRPLDGLRLLHQSIELFGENAATYVNMGLCHYYAENPPAALRCFDRAIELSPDFAVARAWRARVTAEIERLGAGFTGAAPPR